jgi:hypothetical protein
MLWHAIRGSEAVAAKFGKVGRGIHERHAAPRRVLSKVAHIEELLNQTSDKLECATTYLVLDADYHHKSDIIIAERCPGVMTLLPKRMPYTEFSMLWSTGWRP